MTDSPALYFILIGVGITAIGLVVLLYYLNRRRSHEAPVEQVVSDSVPVEPKPTTFLSETDIYKELALYRHDQPVFLRMAENMLAQVMSKSDTMLLRQVVRDFEVKHEYRDVKTALLKKMAESDHYLKNQEKKFRQTDEFEDRAHEREMKKIQMEIDQLSNPPQPPPQTSPDDLKKMQKEERDKRLADARAAAEEHVEFQKIRDAVFGSYNEEKRQNKVRALDRIRDDYARRKVEINQDPLLSPVEKDGQLRALQKEFVRQLEDFEGSL